MKNYFNNISILMEDVESEESQKSEKLNEVELAQLYDILEHQDDLTWPEMSRLIDSHVVDWPRGRNSLRLSMIRMYGLMTGKIPEGIAPAPNWYDLVGALMIKFLEDKGIDVTRHFVKLKQEAQDRMEDKKKRKTRDEALKIMSDYYKGNKFAEVEKKKLIPNRERIIKEIESGKDVSQVFSDAIYIW